MRTLLHDEATHFVASLATTTKSDPPIALIGAEYYAPCFNHSLASTVKGAREGDLLFLALPVSENWRNALAPNATASVFVGANPDPDVVDPRHSTISAAGRMHWEHGRPAWRKGMPSKGRANLHGKMHLVPASPAADPLAACFTAYHPDAAAWKPGSRMSPHLAKWARFEVERIYYVGGFGDEHYIGTIPLDVYRNTSSAPPLVIQ